MNRRSFFGWIGSALAGCVLAQTPLAGKWFEPEPDKWFILVFDDEFAIRPQRWNEWEKVSGTTPKGTRFELSVRRRDENTIDIRNIAATSCRGDLLRDIGPSWLFDSTGVT